MDISSLAKASQIKEITLDGNPVTLNTDYICFLVSYLPNLQLLSTMQINEQTRRAAMAWRTSKEQSNPMFLNLSTQVCMNVRREEVISNAKTNWELFRSRTNVSIDNCNKTATDIKHNSNTLRIRTVNKFNAVKPKSLDKIKTKTFSRLTSINENIEAKKINIKKRSSSSDNLFKLEDTSKSYRLEFKLPPILDLIVDNLTSDKFENIKDDTSKRQLVSDIDNVSNNESDSSESHGSLKSSLRCHLLTSNSCGSSIDYDKSVTLKKNNHNLSPITNFNGEDNNKYKHDKIISITNHKYCDVINEEKNLSNILLENTKISDHQAGQSNCQSKLFLSSSEYCFSHSQINSLDSCKPLSVSSTSSISKNVIHKFHECNTRKDRIKSAQAKKIIYYKSNRAATARAKSRTLAPPNPLLPPQAPFKEREQGRSKF